jgi:hypothetical protein
MVGSAMAFDSRWAANFGNRNHRNCRSCTNRCALQLIWRGDANKTIDLKKNPTKNYKPLQKAVAKLFKNYPPQPSK